MNFHQLHIFYTVSERGSFSAAAQALHMTQPAVTMQVQALEDYFGTKLFNRSTKKIVLSEAGRTLMPFALRSIDLIRETDVAMTELFGGFGADFYAAYQAGWPLDAGYTTRKHLYNLYHVLNHFNLFGGGYAGQAEGMLDLLLAELH